MVHMRKKITFKDIQVGDIIEVTHTNPGGTVTTTVGQADKIYQEEVTDSYGDTIAWSWEDEPNIYLLVRKIGSVPEPEVGGVTFRWVRRTYGVDGHHESVQGLRLHDRLTM